MKKRLPALLLALLLLLALPVSAAEPGEEKALSGICVTADGTVLVSDTFNKVLWSAEGESFTPFAGKIGAADLSGEPVGSYFDAAADKAYFLEPWAIEPWLDGWAVTDSAANVVRYVTEAQVATLAGSGTAGLSNGVGKKAAFSNPTGLASDGSLLYVADTGNGAIRKIDKDGNVSTYVTGLTEPTGLSWQDGALYVAETGQSRILRITNGTVEVLAGVSEAAEDEGEYYGGYADAPAAEAKFDHPQGVLADEDGSVYIADSGNGAVRVLRDGRVYTLARSSADSAAPVKPVGLARKDNALLVTDAFAGVILELALTEPAYSDVPADADCAEAVAEATARGIVAGTGNGQFSPDLDLNRAMFVTMLSRIHRCTDGTVVIDGEGSFDDVPEDAWYAAPVRWAVDLGVTNGVSATAFGPSQALTREQMVTLLFRYAKSQDIDVTVGEDTNILAFEDAFEISAWAIPAFQWACGAGVLEENPDGSLHHADAVTRAEAVGILLRFMEVCGL